MCSSDLYENAKYLVEKDSAFLCEEDCLEENLLKLMREIVNDPKVLQEMKKNISEVSLTDNKKIILKNILSYE